MPAKTAIPDTPGIFTCADNMLIVDYKGHPDPSSSVQQLYHYLIEHKPAYIQEIIAGIHTLAVILPAPSCNREGRSRGIDYLYMAISRSRLTVPARNRTVHLPICYARELAPDLDFIARHAQLETEEIILLHWQNTYQAQLLGFMPGFAYLKGLDLRLHTPRLEKPRQRVPKGSVAIAGEQCAVYPNSTPGGWNLIGATPLELFDPSRTRKNLIGLGDTIIFEKISKPQFERLCKK